MDLNTTLNVSVLLEENATPYRLTQVPLFASPNSFTQEPSVNQASFSAKRSGANQYQKILVIDDNVFNIMGLLSILRKVESVKLIDHVSNGQECVEKISEIIKCNQSDRFYDLLFMDINMPVMDGFEAS